MAHGAAASQPSKVKPMLPTIENAVVSPIAAGFAAIPLNGTPTAHAAFQTSMKKFLREHLEWEAIQTHAGPFEAWDRVVLMPSY